MNDKPKPIVIFDSLTKALQAKGISVGESTGGFRIIKPEDVSIKDFESGKMRITDKGIFVTLEDGTEQQVYLYKRKYHLEEYGKPRYHICNCQTIQSFTNSSGQIPEYRRTNAKEVTVIDMDNGNRETTIKNLPLCKYCSRILTSISSGTDSSQFATILAAAMPASAKPKKNLKVDWAGYTEDWRDISNAYRKKHDYTCEKCGVKVTEFESEFMHTHHINGDKTDNREQNLKCLCIKCHSVVDSAHIKQFQTPAQRMMIRLFVERYKK